MHAGCILGPGAVVGEAALADACTRAPRCSAASRGMTLRPGDIVPHARASNQSTPGGVAEVAVQGIGTRMNHVKDWPCETSRRQAPWQTVTVGWAGVTAAC